MIITPTYSQNSIKAKIEYEEAEKAYINGDYEKAYDKIKLVEQLLSKKNPKILFLRINIENHLLDTNIEIMRELRKSCSYFLDNYQNAAGIEDRYKEVYLISQSLPKTELEYIKYKEKERKKEEEKNEIQRKNQLLEVLKQYKSGFSGVKIGVPLNEIPSSIYNSLVNQTTYIKGTSYYGWTPDKDIIGYSVKYKSMGKPDEGIYSVYVDANNKKVCKVFRYTRSGKRPDEETIFNEYQQLVRILKEKIGEKHVQEEKTDSEYWTGYTVKTTLNDSYIYTISFQKTIKSLKWVQLTEEISAK